MAQTGITHRDLELPLVLALTASPAAGATSATLVTAFPYITGTFAATFSDGETRTVTLTAAATTVTWSGGLVSAVQPSISVAATHPGAQTSTTALFANQNREYFQIQNQGTNQIYVYFGSGASSSVYHFILKGATGAADGTGGSYASAGVVYRGLVTIAGTTPSYSIVEL